MANDGIALFFELSPVVTEVTGTIPGALLPLAAFCLNSVQVLIVLSSVPHGDIIQWQLRGILCSEHEIGGKFKKSKRENYSWEIEHSFISLYKKLSNAERITHLPVGFISSEPFTFLGI